jgi:hypothetical protein
MQTFTRLNPSFHLQCFIELNRRPITGSIRLLFGLFLFNTIFYTTTQAQQCPYNISLASRTYNSTTNRTTFVWKVVNPNPGNGNNGTAQDLSHWGFTANTCSNPADALKESDIISAGTGSGSTPGNHSSIKVEIKRDPSQDCTGNTPVLKFDAGGNGSTPKYYSLVLNGNWGPGDLHAYYKSGSRTGCGLCTISGAGVGCRSTQVEECNITIPLISTNPICAGTSAGIVTVTNPQAGKTYQLLRDGAETGTAVMYTSGTLSFTGLIAGNYAVRASFNSCIPVSSATIAITNIVLPAPTFSTIGTLCPGATTSLSVTFPSGTAVSAITWSGTGVNGTTFTAPAIPGNYTITINAIVNGCTFTSTRVITVANTPAPVFSAIGPLCPGATATLMATFPAGTTVTNEVWSGSGVSGKIFTAPATAGTYEVNSSATVNGCSVSGSLTILVTPTPSPIFGTIGTLCPGTSATLTATYPAGTTVSNVVWSGSGVNGTTFTAPATGGNYTVTYSATVNGCVVNGSLVITVATVPAPAFNNIGTLCPGATTTLSATFPSGTTVTGISWSGTGVTGTTSTAPTAAANYAIIFNATVNGCAFTTTRTITVANAPAPTFGTIGALCPGATAMLTATFPAGNTVTNVVWNGTGVSGTTFTAPTTPGAYTVNYSATVNNCTVTGSLTITVIAAAAGNYTLQVTSGGLCAGGGGSFLLSLSGSEAGASYQLVRDGSNVGAPVAGTGSAINFPSQPVAGNYSVIAIATAVAQNACVACTVIIGPISVAPATIPTPTFGTVDTLCPGASATLSATFPDGTTIANVSWSGNGVSGTTFTAPATGGNYVVTYSATVNGCPFTTTLTIVVANVPAPTFESIGTLCPGATTMLTATFPRGTIVSNMVWSGTGVSGTTFTAPAAGGNYTANFSATVNGCVITASRTITVATVPTPTFGSIGTLCPGSTANLTATFPAATTVTNVVWSGTGVSGSTFTAPLTVGAYPVNYSATVNGCVVTGSITITVAAAPAPVFTPVGPLCAGVKALLIATFPAGTTVSNIVWRGTGVSGNVFTAPMITSQTSYPVNFSATVNSCTVTGSMVIVVNPIPNPLYLAVYDYCPGESGGRIEVRGIEAGVSYQIRVVGGAAIGPVQTGAAGTNLSFTNIPAGYYQILSTNLTTGCVNAFGGATVSQLAVPPCSITGPASVCMGTTNTYTVQTGTGVTNIEWSVQGGNCTIVGSSSSPTASVKAVGPGTFKVRVLVSYGGCTTTCEFTVTSTPLAVSAGDFIACPNSTITLTGNPAGGVWASTNTQVQTALNNNNSTFNSTGIPVGNYPVTYTVTQANGCTGTALGSITVFGSAVLGRLAGLRLLGFSNTVNVTMNNSREGIIYQLMRDGINVGSPVKGNGDRISFGTQDASGMYSVAARTESGDCMVTGDAGRIAVPVAGMPNRLEVVAYPNPFSDQIRFSITSPQSGKGTLQLFDLKGSKIKTIDVGSINAGQTINVEYAVPGPNRVSMTYKLNVGDQESSGKLINIK